MVVARIRTIKPEFWTSEKIVECSVNARLLFIGLWNFADDEGRMEDKPKRIKMQVFPGDDFNSDDVAGMLQELSKNDLIIRYSIDGKEIIQVKGWDHQRIDKPNQSKLPPYSENDPRPIREPSPPEREKERDSSDSSEKEIGRAKRAPHNSGTKIPPGFPGEAEFAYPRSRGWSETQIQEQAFEFREYWLSPDAAKGGRKKDWKLTWERWVRNTRRTSSPKQSQSDKDDEAFREAARRIGANQ